MSSYGMNKSQGERYSIENLVNSTVIVFSVTDGSCYLW